VFDRKYLLHKDQSGKFPSGQRQIFFTDADFVYNLTQRLGDPNVSHIVAKGIFNDSNSILTTDFLIVGLQ
jgi:hypothetical protein